jgi:hypothetical protein
MVSSNGWSTATWLMPGRGMRGQRQARHPPAAACTRCLAWPIRGVPPAARAWSSSRRFKAHASSLVKGCTAHAREHVAVHGHGMAAVSVRGPGIPGSQHTTAGKSTARGPAVAARWGEAGRLGAGSR